MLAQTVTVVFGLGATVVVVVTVDDATSQVATGMPDLLINDQQAAVDFAGS